MASFLSITAAIDGSTLDNVEAMLSGLFVGTLLLCLFDPVAKTLVCRGFKGAWKRQSKF